jgi:hypothetical protein
VLDAVVMGNKQTVGAMTEKDELLALPELTDEQGAGSASSRAPSPKKDGYTAESDAGDAARGPRHPRGGAQGR